MLSAYSFHVQKERPTAQHAPNTTTLKPAATNSNNPHRNNLEAASTLLQGLNPSGGLFEQVVVHEAHPVLVKEDARSEHMLSYVNKPNIGTAPEQAHSEFKQDEPPHMDFQPESLCT
ncbi:hypothetical protein C0995_016118 [Termitomyces sp. Mi166|nr:hypothetical protein C0995_016118 [Termitomyces sp. Mi166\